MGRTITIDPVTRIEGHARVEVDIDDSGSMGEEQANLTQNFPVFVDKLDKAGIDYRIGVTGDNDNGWRTPAGWAGPSPWFDSLSMTDEDIATAFSNAAGSLVDSMVSARLLPLAAMGVLYGSAAHAKSLSKSPNEHSASPERPKDQDASGDEGVP